MATKPATKQLNSKQKEILARKLGYDGPMNMFEEFIKSDPAMSAKYSTVVEKFMARGGMAKKYAKGGVLKMAQGGAPTPPQYPLTYQEDGQTKNIDFNFWQNRLSDPTWASTSTAKKVKQVIDSVGGMDKARQLVNDYNAKKASYDINSYKYTLSNLQTEYNNNPTLDNLNKVRTEFANAATYFSRLSDEGIVPASDKTTYTNLSTQYENEYNKIIKERQDAEAKAEAEKLAQRNLYTSAISARDKLRSDAETRKTTELDRLATERDTLLSTIDTNYSTDLNTLENALSSGQIDGQQYAAEKAKIDTVRKNARDAAQTNYTNAANTVRTQSETDFALGATTYEDIMSGKTQGTQQFNLPEYTPINIAQNATYTPMQFEVPVAQPSTTPQPATTTPATTTTAPVTLMGATPTTTGSPVATPSIPQVQARGVPLTQEQLVSAEGAPAQAATVQPNVVGQVATAAPVAPKEAATVEAATATPGMTTALEGVQPVTGTVSPEAQVQAQTMEPTSTKVSDLTAATGEATMVQPTAPRTVQEGELVAGPTVDMGRVEGALAQNVAAQGEVTPEMTVAGQLQKLTADFDATNPPTWAAGAIRGVNAELARRGVGASSMAGQAILQTALESALPIAAADAKVYQDMGIQNLSNRQQMAVLTAQQRAAFLGQEFDQAFQTRVTNAATISEIANINFTAEQQIALENARLTNTVNLANLSNQQALIMAEAAQIANLETANLNNRQQAAVLNAQAFLQMDMANLANEQQTELFKAQSMVNSLLTDAAAENAARQFNATSINQVNQFYDGLRTQISQFNATQTNAMNQFNVSQINAVAEFNASSQNARDQFNAEYRRVIDQSNAEWRRNIALADTAAVNRANEINAANALGITTIDYNNTWQTYRDQLEMAWKTGESALDRENQLAMQVLAKQAQIEAAKYSVEVAKYEALGGLTATVLDKGGIASDIGSVLKKAGTSGLSAITNAFGASDTWQLIGDYTSNQYANDPAYGWQYFNDGTDGLAISPDGVYYKNGVEFYNTLEEQGYYFGGGGYE